MCRITPLPPLARLSTLVALRKKSVGVPPAHQLFWDLRNFRCWRRSEKCVVPPPLFLNPGSAPEWTNPLQQMCDHVWRGKDFNLTLTCIHCTWKKAQLYVAVLSFDKLHSNSSQFPFFLPSGVHSSSKWAVLAGQGVWRWHITGLHLRQTSFSCCTQGFPWPGKGSNVLNVRLRIQIAPLLDVLSVGKSMILYSQKTSVLYLKLTLHIDSEDSLSSHNFCTSMIDVGQKGS